MTFSRPAARLPAPGTVAGDGASAPAPRPWPVRRLFPVLAAIGLVAIGMAVTTWWGPAIVGRTTWTLPDDLWGTLVAGQRFARLDLGGLYTQPTGLVSLPGAAAILAPVAAVIDAAGLSLQVPGPHNVNPTVWLLAGPYQIAVSCVTLFAADAIAERLGLTLLKRAALAAAGAVTLWNVAVLWGHPEDAVAVGLLLYAVLALSEGRAGRSAWLTGAAVAVQPLVLLALPVMLMLVEPRRLAGYLARAAAPSAVLLAAAAAANWSATTHAVTSQPNWPTVDHPTPWNSLAPHLSGGAVAAGPARVVAIAAACGCALVARHRWRAVRSRGADPPEPPAVRSRGDGPPEPSGRRRSAQWSPDTLQQVLWWVAVTLALRSVFEPVMVAYYVWPVLAVALIPAARRWPHLLLTAAVTSTLTFVSQATWRGEWAWWTPMVGGLALTLIFARLPVRERAPGTP